MTRFACDICGHEEEGPPYETCADCCAELCDGCTSWNTGRPLCSDCELEDDLEETEAQEQETLLDEEDE